MIDGKWSRWSDRFTYLSYTNDHPTEWTTFWMEREREEKKDVDALNCWTRSFSFYIVAFHFQELFRWWFISYNLPLKSLLVKSALLYNIKKCIFCMEFVVFSFHFIWAQKCSVRTVVRFHTVHTFQFDLNNDSDDVTLKKHEINV